MKEIIRSADILPDIHAPKTASKCSENQRLPQERFADFLDYIKETVGATLTGMGQDHHSVDAALEGRMRDLFSRYIVGDDGDAIDRYAYADSTFCIYLYNGKHYERLEQKKFAFLIRKAMTQMEMGVVYRHKSSEPIAKSIIEDMVSTGVMWKPNSRYMVFRNGVLDTEDMTLHEHSPEYMTNIVFPDLDYQPDAECPTFRKVVADALDKDTANVLQEMCGYLLFPDSRHEKIGVLVGEGRNGKSVILNMISYALGEENVTHFGLQQITDASGVFIANMVGKLANICHDSGNLIKVGNEGILKQYASGEPIMAKVLYHQPTITTNYPHSIVAVNALPVSADVSDGYFRRFLIIDFPHQIPLNKVDRQLFQKMKPERMGVLLWIIEGMKRLLSESDFSESKAVDDIKKQYQRDNNIVATFVDEFEFRPSRTEMRPLDEVFRMFKTWTKDNNYRDMGKRTFSTRLKGLKFRTQKVGVTMVYIESDKDLPEADLRT